MLSTYLPAVQAAHEGEGPAGCTVQLHMVSPQDEVTQLHAVQRLGLGHVQATHEAASADVNGALAGRGWGLRAQRSPGAPQSGFPHRTPGLTCRWQCCRTLPGPSRTGPSSRQLTTALPAPNSGRSCGPGRKL